MKKIFIKGVSYEVSPLSVPADTDPHWSVKNLANGNVYHTSAKTCDCADATFREKICKHADAIRDMLAPVWYQAVIVRKIAGLVINPVAFRIEEATVVIRQGTTVIRLSIEEGTKCLKALRQPVTKKLVQAPK